MRCRDIISRIEQDFPPAYAEDWDNVGLLVGHKKQDVHKIMVSLDATQDVVDQAVKSGVQMLITHHPMIFHGTKSVTDDDFLGRKILRLAENQISYYAMHTNFDVMGMAEALADMLGLKKQEVLMEVVPQKGSTHLSEKQQGIGRIGYLEQEMTLLQYAKLVKETLGISYVTVSGKADSMVQRVAVSSGSGKSMIPHALQKSADVLVTGDIGHHEALDAREQQLAIIDAGHYGTEKLFAGFMEKWFAENLPELDCVQAVQKNTFFVV